MEKNTSVKERGNNGGRKDNKGYNDRRERNISFHN